MNVTTSAPPRRQRPAKDALWQAIWSRLEEPDPRRLRDLRVSCARIVRFGGRRRSAIVSIEVIA